jgi:RNA polymerase sigma factor (sigma-70 family)
LSSLGDKWLVEYLKNAKRRKRFEEMAQAYVGAAYNLARRLTRNERDAEDLVQETFLRAFQAFERFQGDHSRAWLLTIVRNTYYTWRRLNKLHDLDESFDEHAHAAALSDLPHNDSCSRENPERLVLLQADLQLINQSVDALPLPLREVLVLREFEGLSYREIAEIIDVPKGTVMSRLSRARRTLQRHLESHVKPSE